MEVLEIPVEDRLNLFGVDAHTLASFDDQPEVADSLYIEPGLLDIALEVSVMEAVDYFLDLVKVGLIAILVCIDQDVVSVSAGEQI